MARLTRTKKYYWDRACRGKKRSKSRLKSKRCRRAKSRSYRHAPRRSKTTGRFLSLYSKASQGSRHTVSRRSKATGRFLSLYSKASRRGRGRHTASRRSKFTGLFLSVYPKASRRNPERRLRDGTLVELHPHGQHDGIVRIHYPDGSMRDHRYRWLTALKHFHQIKSGREHERIAVKEDWRQLAMENPKRHRRGRRASRCNPAQFPMPFMSALNPRSRRNAPMTHKEALALARVLRKHGHPRCRV